MALYSTLLERNGPFVRRHCLCNICNICNTVPAALQHLQHCTCSTATSATLYLQHCPQCGRQFATGRGINAPLSPTTMKASVTSAHGYNRLLRFLATPTRSHTDTSPASVGETGRILRAAPPVNTKHNYFVSITDRITSLSHGIGRAPSTSVSGRVDLRSGPTPRFPDTRRLGP